MFEKTLVAIDGSNESAKALAAAIAIAKRFRSALHSIYVRRRLSRYVVTVAEVVDEKEEIDISAFLATESALVLAEREEVNLKCEVRRGHRVNAVVDFARERNFDLTVIGSRSRGGVFGPIWPNGFQKLASVAPCSVLFVR